MVIGEWRRRLNEWEAAKVALDSIQEDIYSEVTLFLKGEGLGPTHSMFEACQKLLEQEVAARQSLNEYLAQLPIPFSSTEQASDAKHLRLGYIKQSGRSEQ